MLGQGWAMGQVIGGAGVIAIDSEIMAHAWRALRARKFSSDGQVISAYNWRKFMIAVLRAGLKCL